MNDANNANFTELSGHITAELARLSDAERSKIETITDYYDRALQLRVMHNNDLTSDLESASARLQVYKRQLSAIRSRQRIALCGVVLGLSKWYGALDTFLAMLRPEHILAGTVGGVLAWLFQK